MKIMSSGNEANLMFTKRFDAPINQKLLVAAPLQNCSDFFSSITKDDCCWYR